MEQHRKHYWEVLLVVFVVFIVGITILSMFFFRKMVSDAAFQEATAGKHYKKHYVLIADDYSDPVWDSVYEGAKEYAKEKGAYVEFFGRNLSTSYGVEELVRIATKADVDGIFVVGDESKKTKDAINEAVKKRIPVITVMNDSPTSKRQCFVGVNGYTLGQQYAKQVISLAKGKKKLRVYVLMNSDHTDTSKNSVFLGIKDYLQVHKKQIRKKNIELQEVTIENKGEFSSDEMIRDLVLESSKTPDVLICLNDVDTSCAYQAVVDYNIVGRMKILGYYSSKETLKAIQMKIINSTITMDAKEMGKQCVAAMTEYEKTGYVSEYVPVTTELIDEKNVRRYLDR